MCLFWYRYFFISMSMTLKTNFTRTVTFFTPTIYRYMRKSEKRMLFVGSKKTDFYIEGHTLKKTIVFDFLYFFIEEKNFASILKNIYFLYSSFLIFSPFLPFDLFGLNLTLVLTKGRSSTAHLS